MQPSEYAEFVELIEQGIPFNAYMGMKVRAMEKGMCALFLPYRAELVGDARRGALHGGTISTLIDTCGGFAIWTMCAIKDRIATIDLRVDYLNPALKCGLVAESRVRLMGNRVGNVHTEVYADGDHDTVLAEGRSVYNIRRAR